MTQNASVSIGEHGQVIVTAYKEFRCPACGRCLLEVQGEAKIKIVCGRCRGVWKLEAGGTTKMIKPPRHIAGKILLDIVEKFGK